MANEDSLVSALMNFSNYRHELFITKSLYDDTEKNYEIKIKEIDGIFKESLKVNNSMKIEKEIDKYGDEYYYKQEIFPYFFRNSIFLVFISQFENQLNNYCDILQNVFACSRSVNDCSGHGIEKYKTYINDTIGLSGWEQTKEWSAIRTDIKIRNAIAHNGNTINDKKLYKNQVLKYYLKKSYITIDDSQIFKLEFLFINAVYNDLVTFWLTMKNTLIDFVKLNME
jgi:hypothetical protein